MQWLKKNAQDKPGNQAGFKISEASASSRTPLTLNALITRLILFCVTPLLLLALYLSVVHVLRIREEAGQHASRVARNVTTVIDNNLKSRISGLQLLAESPLAGAPVQLPLLYKEALGFRVHFGGHVILADPTLQMLFNTRVPFGESLPKLPTPKGFAAAPYALQYAKPAVGDTFTGNLDKQQLIAVAVPVVGDGKTRLILINTIETDWIQHLLDGFGLPTDLEVTIRDGKNAVIASRVGQDAPIAAGESASSWVIKSEVTHWSVSVAMPYPLYLQPIAITTATIFLLMLIATFVSVMLGRMTGQRLSDAMATLSQHGAALDAERPIIKEVEDVRSALEAEQLFRQKVESALNESENRWRFAIEGSGDGLWDWNIPAAKTFFSVRWKAMLGYSESEISDNFSEWEKIAHPEDKARVLNAVQAYFDGKASEFAEEYRVRCKDGRWKWILGRGMLIEKDAAGKPVRMIGTNTDITKRKETEAQIEYLAYYDHLTALPNRRLLLDRLAHALAASSRSGQTSALIFIDLDDFKTLNDTWGHQTGDAMLLQVARLLTQTVRDQDTVSRLGGDEFVLVIENLGQDRDEAAAHAASVCDKLLAAIGQPLQLHECELTCSASIGITLFSNEAITIDTLMGQGDSAMYMAKAAGRNTYRFFDATLRASLAARAEFEADLRQSIKNNELHLLYQPQTNSDGNVVGAEALLRWTHPVRGAVPPVQFIPVAEKSNYILELGSWVLQQACQTLIAWEKDQHTAHLTLSVNVSIRQISQENFIGQFLEALRATGANPARLKIELTESIFANDVDDIARKMHRLKSEGVTFSLDDFGTGYSSLSYIKRLPFDQIKIDQVFIRDVLADQNDAAIVCTVIALCRSLGVSAIAEGVETAGQRAFLEKNGCHLFQGYLFSQPLNFGEISQFLEKPAA